MKNLASNPFSNYHSHIKILTIMLEKFKKSTPSARTLNSKLNLTTISPRRGGGGGGTYSQGIVCNNPLRRFRRRNEGGSPGACNMAATGNPTGTESSAGRSYLAVNRNRGLFRASFITRNIYSLECVCMGVEVERRHTCGILKCVNMVRDW